MNSLIRKAKTTLQHDGPKVLGIRLFNYSLVKLKRLVRKKDVENLNKWAQLKDKYKGKRIFIMGNGPSLNKTPLYLLRDDYTMCFNRVNLLFERVNWKPELYAVVDDLVIKDNYEEINREVLPKVKYAFFPDIHPSNIDVTDYISHAPNVHWFISDKPEFRADLPNLGHNKTVVNAGLQIAAYLGFSEIYLIGVDADFGDQKVKKITSRDWEASEDDPNHFDPRYFQKGRKYHNPTVSEMVEQFAIGKAFFDKLGVAIFNAGIGGKLDVFPRVDFSSLFQFTEQQTFKLLSDTEALTEMNLSFEKVYNEAIMVNEIDAPYPDLFKTTLELGLQLIPKLIHSFLPVGPYNEEYFFVKR